MLADLERTRAETGALQFYIHRDRFDRNLFVIYEVWRDVKALREHFEEPYVLQFVADSAQYIDGNMEVQWLVMAGDYVAQESRGPRAEQAASAMRAAIIDRFGDPDVLHLAERPEPEPKPGEVLVRTRLRGRELHRRDDTCRHRRGRGALSRHPRLGPGGNAWPRSVRASPASARAMPSSACLASPPWPRPTPNTSSHPRTSSRSSRPPWTMLARRAPR